jgi:hypothetical protein
MGMRSRPGRRANSVITVADDLEPNPQNHSAREKSRDQSRGANNLPEVARINRAGPPGTPPNVAPNPKGLKTLRWFHRPP